MASGIARLAARSFGWGSAIAATRLVCSFLSIKVTAVMLGPAGLALVAQLAGFISLMQSLLAQGLVTGQSRLAAERPDDPAWRDRVWATSAHLLAGIAAAAALSIAAASGPLAAWLLTDERHRHVLALAGLAVAAAMAVDLLYGALGVTREVGLIGRASVLSIVAGLAVFAPSAWVWGLQGALWASLAAAGLACAVAVMTVARGSSGVRLRSFIGPFDAAIARRLAGFYPMLVTNAVLPPLGLILARSALADAQGLDTAGLWQAAWRLSEACHSVVIASVAMFFMPAMGERANDLAACRALLLRTLGMATAAAATLAGTVGLLREPLVHIVFARGFDPVVDYLPLQLLGDVLRLAGWILSMGLVALLRTGRFLAVTAASWGTFIALSTLSAPSLSVHGVLWAHVAAHALGVALAAWALRDVLMAGPPTLPAGAAPVLDQRA